MNRINNNKKINEMNSVVENSIWFQFAPFLNLLQCFSVSAVLPLAFVHQIDLGDILFAQAFSLSKIVDPVNVLWKRKTADKKIEIQFELDPMDHSHSVQWWHSHL